MFYGECYKCGERWELGTASTCKCPDLVTWDASAPIVGPYYVKDNPQVVMWSGPPTTDWIGYGHGTNEWARIDKDLNLVRLDMDLCAKGPANAYTALAVGIWNAALDEAARYAAGEGNDTLADSIRELKK